MNFRLNPGSLPLPVLTRENHAMVESKLTDF